MKYANRSARETLARTNELIGLLAATGIDGGEASAIVDDLELGWFDESNYADDEIPDADQGPVIDGPGEAMLKDLMRKSDGQSVRLSFMGRVFSVCRSQSKKYKYRRWSSFEAEREPKRVVFRAKTLEDALKIFVREMAVAEKVAKKALTPPREACSRKIPLTVRSANLGRRVVVRRPIVRRFVTFSRTSTISRT